MKLKKSDVANFLVDAMSFYHLTWDVNATYKPSKRAKHIAHTFEAAQDKHRIMMKVADQTFEIVVRIPRSGD